jgi:hypothetical protein
VTGVVLLCLLDREASARRAAGLGALVGVALLMRPTSLFLLLGVVVAWFAATGLRGGAWRRGLGLSVPRGSASSCS